MYKIFAMKKKYLILIYGMTQFFKENINFVDEEKSNTLFWKKLKLLKHLSNNLRVKKHSNYLVKEIKLIDESLGIHFSMYHFLLLANHILDIYYTVV